MYQDISNDVTEIEVFICYVIVSPIITIAGIVTNVINIVVYSKHAVRESINVTFLTLAITDLAGLVCCVWYGIGVNPLLSSRTDLSFNSVEVTYLTGAYPRILFTKMTCWITVYVSLERCYCIVVPLHVKTMITPRRTAWTLAGLYAVGIITSFPVFYSGSLFLEWKTDPLSNRTVLGMGMSTYYAEVATVSVVSVASLFLTSFVIIILTTVVLAAVLNKKSKWRQRSGNYGKNRSKYIGNRDITLSKTIVLLSSVLIVSYLPYTVNCLLMAVLDGFDLYGKYNNLFIVMWSISWLFETLNSTSSIFIYYSMSTKYRETFLLLFGNTSCSTAKQYSV
ncbi:G-protein coupled receptor [Biomphalaria glabrata]|nr:putative G-protein coupled receptor [Biomphalaria glabrata]